MRLIKFRIWSKITKGWERDTYIENEIPNTNDARLILSDGSYNSDEIFEQFTGLLDKNRKEIYEGDIIRDIFLTKTGDGSVDFIFHVAYIPPSFFLLRNKGQEYFRNPFDMEIIGNIHENSELLK